MSFTNVSSPSSSVVSVSTESASLYLSEQVVAIDRYAINALTIPAEVLMKRAGKAAFDQLLQSWPELERLHIVCGAGNNAGDGYVIAALAQQRQLAVTVWSMVDPEQQQGAALSAYRYAQQENVECVSFDIFAWEEANAAAIDNTVIVDALLGTGAKGEPRSGYAAAIIAMNDSQCPVLAVDIPSGVDANTGHVASVAVRADVTVSVVGQKRGLLTGAGRAYSGQRFFTDLGIPLSGYEHQEPVAQVINAADWLPLLPERHSQMHKGQCGHLAVIGGDKGYAYGYGGAPIMAAQMALRTGAGLVSLAIRPDFVNAALARQPEMMVAGIENGQALLPLLERATGMVVGPGLGRSPWSEQLFYHTIASHKPLVIDADALHLMSNPAFLDVCTLALDERQWILTPHAGEAAVLLGVTVEAIEADRFAAAIAIQQRYGGAVVLKGAGSIVITSTGEQWLCNQGNVGMASGGMGDVLSGLLGSLVVQGMSIDAAALLGVSLHAAAADHIVQQRGMRGLLATDLIPCIRDFVDGIRAL